MSKTRHFQTRMTQRGITQDLVQLVLDHGEAQHDGKIVLTKKALRALQEKLVYLNRVTQKAMNKGGIVVVEEGGNLITTYNLGDRGPLDS